MLCVKGGNYTRFVIIFSGWDIVWSCCCCCNQSRKETWERWKTHSCKSVLENKKKSKTKMAMQKFELQNLWISLLKTWQDDFRIIKVSRVCNTILNLKNQTLNSRLLGSILHLLCRKIIYEASKEIDYGIKSWPLVNFMNLVFRLFSRASGSDIYRPRCSSRSEKRSRKCSLRYEQQQLSLLLQIAFFHNCSLRAKQLLLINKALVKVILDIHH